MPNVVIRPVQTGDMRELLGLMYQYIVDFYQRPRTWETAKDNHVAQAMYDKLGGERSEWVVYEMS